MKKSTLYDYFWFLRLRIKPISHSPLSSQPNSSKVRGHRKCQYMSPRYGLYYVFVFIFHYNDQCQVAVTLGLIKIMFLKYNSFYWLNKCVNIITFVEHYSICRNERMVLVR